MLLHLALETDWTAALTTGAYPVSTRGASIDEVGFMHACRDLRQVHAVADAFYADTGDGLVLLVVDPGALPAGYEVRDEPAPGTRDTFPHVYGGDLPVAAVVDVRPFGAVRPHDLADLTAGMASPYPSVRDGWAVRELAEGLRAGRFGRDELLALGGVAQRRLGSREVHERAGAHLTLRLLAEAGVLDRSSYAASTAALLAERDTRGHDPRLGRLGSLAHGLDYQASAVRAGIASPAEVLATVARRVTTEDAAVWTQGEEVRAAHAMVAALAGGCTPADAVSWAPLVQARLTALDAMAPGPDPAWLAHTRSTLALLHTALAEEPLVDGEPVTPPVADAVAAAVRAACVRLLARMAPRLLAPRP